MAQSPRDSLPEDESLGEDQQAQRLEQLYEAVKQSKDSDLASPEDADLQEALTILKALDRIGPIEVEPSVGLDVESAAERETQFDLETIDSALRFDSSDQLPAQLGRFQIQRLLGRGGHGMVLLARDEKLRREVALKLPRPDVVLDPFLKQRFVQEAQFAAAVSHPNLVPVYEAGVIGPFCYIAYAFCEGTSLSAWLKRRKEPVDPSLAARIIAVLAASDSNGAQPGHRAPRSQAEQRATRWRR